MTKGILAIGWSSRRASKVRISGTLGMPAVIRRRRSGPADSFRSLCFLRLAVTGPPTWPGKRRPPYKVSCCDASRARSGPRSDRGPIPPSRVGNILRSSSASQRHPPVRRVPTRPVQTPDNKCRLQDPVGCGGSVPLDPSPAACALQASAGTALASSAGLVWIRPCLVRKRRW
jgi:hypothetical protein